MSKKKYFLSETEFQVIREYYDGTTSNLNKIMQILNGKYPRWYIRRIAAENGWANPKPVNWSEREETWLHENYPKKGFVAVQNGLRRINGGITRSVCAILLKAKRLNINKRSSGLTMRMMEDLLGADHHKIEKWLTLGLLSAKRKGTKRKEIQGGDMWHFEPRAVREFVINNPQEIDIRRVESFSFIQLLTNRM